MPGSTFVSGEVAYAGFPSVHLFDAPDGKKVEHLIWGDWLTILPDEPRNGWRRVHARGEDGWLRERDLLRDRLLEIVFVDIGQGDGALISTPDDEHLIVDAGEEDNMYRFLRWRFGRFQRPFLFKAAVISHPDEDHYGGFRTLVDDPNVRFGTLYHNGIVERAGPDGLGPVVDGFLTDVISDRAELEALLTPGARGRREYPNLLSDMLESGRVGDARSIAAADGTLPDFDGSRGAGIRIEVLGPVDDRAGGSPRLRTFGNDGKTKNGHSVVLRIVYKDVSVLVGGDLNVPAENHLLAAHTGLSAPAKDAEGRSRLIDAARKVFGADVAKACHHGSADFSDTFLAAVNPLATVISSGDDEPHSHPRADALGAIGRWGRGDRPLIFSTELARSAPEAIRQPAVLRLQLTAAFAALNAATDDVAKGKAQRVVDGLLKQIERSVAVYGAINLRTNGRQVIIAQKLERPDARGNKWDVYPLVRDDGGELVYRSKHG